jgi:outer membrane murein-binding lipoprotein Lpp
MEARIARLESDVAHLLSDVTDIKTDVRALRDRMDAGNAKLGERLDAVASQLNAKFDGLKDAFAAAKIWALFLYIALATVNLSALARGLGWI